MVTNGQVVYFYALVHYSNDVKICNALYLKAPIRVASLVPSFPRASEYKGSPMRTSPPFGPPPL